MQIIAKRRARFRAPNSEADFNEKTTKFPLTSSIQMTKGSSRSKQTTASEQVRWIAWSASGESDSTATRLLPLVAIRRNIIQPLQCNPSRISTQPLINRNDTCKSLQHQQQHQQRQETTSKLQMGPNKLMNNSKCKPNKEAIRLFLATNKVILRLALLAAIFSWLSAYSSAYQLTNSLIANNLPPRFVGGGGSSASSPSGQQQTEIVVRVKEGPQSIGKLIYTLKAEDPDDDPLTFGVLGSMANELLRIENVPGNQANVYLRKELDRETTESYQVVITLTDGKLGRSNWVEDVNDNYPVFAPHRTAISLREDTNVPMVFETLEATDQDEGRFGQVIYKLVDESANGVSNFAIETVDGKGVISLVRPLDFEQKVLYQLRVLAIDRAAEHERLSASTSILITVQDCDDQGPIFTFVPSITRISEILPVGSAIVQVAAVDGDRGINNPIQYDIVAVNGQQATDAINLFSINPDSGLISVAQALDRETSTSSIGTQIPPGKSQQQQQQAGSNNQQGSYVIQVKATELNTQLSKEASSISTELTVILTDVNDELPTFDREEYFGEIFENSTPETLVNFVLPQSSASLSSRDIQAKVVDKDQGTNATFTLHLEGENSNLFDVWPREATNEVNFILKVASTPQAADHLASPLDFERVKQFSFKIVAKEKYASGSSSAQITIYLRDSNDNYPQFESELYRVEIPENAIRGMHICAVRASDSDSGLYGSQGIRYTEIRGEKANKFKLDPVTGVVSLKTNEHGFDRETTAQHHLIVEARDNNGTGNRNTTQLLIVLADVNDQRPKFQLDQYEASIYENELDFQSPLQVHAVDNDAPNSLNSKITYSIVAGDPQSNFTIDPQTGRIRVRETLSAASPARSVTAMSPLPGESDIIISDGHEAGGKSQSLGGLDFERIAQKQDESRLFNLTVRATDSGLPEQLSSTTSVIVFVYDKNDHAPVFTRNVYSKSIREDAKEGSAILQVLAQDGDHSPTNSKITYRIASGASDKFVIDSDTGLISLAPGASVDIDRMSGWSYSSSVGEQQKSYILGVSASDGSFGPNQKSSSALVNITILDINNKPPEFVSLGASRWQSAPAAGQPLTTVAPSSDPKSQQLAVVYVNEDAPFGLIVTKVVAVDPDSSAELRYSINYARSEARNEDMLLVDPVLIKDLFLIEPTDGTIRVARQLDRELFDQVKLRLQVEDIAAQTPDQVAFAHLLIKITDVNDNKPQFKKPLYKAVVNENSISGTSVTTVTADDRDLNKTLKYSLDGSPEMLRLIRINPRSGEVTVNDKIDRELYTLINVTVKAEDFGHPHPLVGVSQLIITIRDENDNNPVFVNSSRSILPYDLDGASTNQAGPKNHDMQPSLRSLADPTNLAGSQVGGDQRLPLLAPGARVELSEDSPIGYQVAYVHAEDADLGNNGRITYLLDASSTGGKFKIDRDSGVISVAGLLDREQVKQYTLIIEASDNYDLGYATGESRRAFTQVQVLITDKNDNAPVIETNLQVGQAHQPGRLGLFPSYEDLMNSQGPYEVPLAECLFIDEFQAMNEPILTITATDADDPSTQNGQIDLAIINNQPQQEIFALNPIRPSMAVGPQTTTTTGRPLLPLPLTTTTNVDFADLNLGENADENADRPMGGWPGSRRRVRRFAGIEEALSELRGTGVSSNFHHSLPRVATFSIPSSRTSRPKSTLAPYTTTSTTMSPSSSSSLSPALPPAVTMATTSSIQRPIVESGEQQVHVVVSRSLKERVGNYSILVRATDRGNPPLSSVKQINICVQDVNNHAPVFVRPPLNHTIRIMENATIGTSVTQVEATDDDRGSNGELQYLLKPTNIQNSNNDWQSFKIDRMSGLITTNKLFNRQVKKYYTLRVQAQDFGKPTSLSSDIDINIMIVNSGQYQPEFESQLQSVVFTENVAPGVEWYKLFPTTNQDDEIPNGSGVSMPQVAAPCYFIIDSDDLEQTFHLDRYSHKLTNQRLIDRERKSNYTLLIQASNNCNSIPKTPINTRILDSASIRTGAGEPISIDYRSSEDYPATKRAARSTKHTSGANVTQAAKLISQPEPEQPTILNQATLAALLASDKTLLQVTIKVKDVNDNAPKFTQQVYTGGITTEADYGTVFMVVQASDADADANGQVVYSIVRPIKRNLIAPDGMLQKFDNKSTMARLKRAAPATSVTTLRPRFDDMDPNSIAIDSMTSESGDDLFVIHPQTGEISLNFDPQKQMKGYFEFEIMANDTEGLSDTAKVFIYLLRQDQRVKFVLRLTPQELRQRLNKFRSVFGNITGAIVNIDSYKYYENHDGTVDKKKTSLFLHFVNPDDNTIIDVDKVLTLIDNNIEYLDELYKEFHVLSSEAAHLPMSSSALVDPIDQVRTGLLGIASFLALILILVIFLCINQRTKYERQLKAATVGAFGGSPLALDPDFHSQSNLPNTNLHSQDPNPIWMNGYHHEQEWLNQGGKSASNGGPNNNNHNGPNSGINSHAGVMNIGIEEADYLSSGNSDMNSLSGLNSVTQLHYNGTSTTTPRDSLNSSQGRSSDSNIGTGSGSSGSTTNDQQALCHNRLGANQQAAGAPNQGKLSRAPEKPLGPSGNNKSDTLKKRSQLNGDGGASVTLSTFGAFKEVTIYTDNSNHLSSQSRHVAVEPSQQTNQKVSNMIRAVANEHHQHQQQQQQQHDIHQKRQQQQRQQQQQSLNNKQPTSQVNRIASQFNAKQKLLVSSKGQQQQQQPQTVNANSHQRILVHVNGTDPNHGIIKNVLPAGPQDGGQRAFGSSFDTTKLNILNLETTEL